MQNQFALLTNNLDNSVNSLNVTAREVGAKAEENNKVWLWIAIGVAAIFVILLIGFLVYFFMKSKKKTPPTVEEEVTTSV